MIHFKRLFRTITSRWRCYIFSAQCLFRRIWKFSFLPVAVLPVWTPLDKAGMDVGWIWTFKIHLISETSLHKSKRCCANIGLYTIWRENKWLFCPDDVTFVCFVSASLWVELPQTQNCTNKICNFSIEENNLYMFLCPQSRSSQTIKCTCS